MSVARENEARQQRKPGALHAKTFPGRRFLDEHPGRWVGPFTAAVRDREPSAFYSGLAALTDSFVKMEAGGNMVP